MIEIVIALFIIALSIVAFLSSTHTVAQVNDSQAEAVCAIEAARRVAETMQTEHFEQVFARYNGTTADDPTSGGVSPGSDFDVPELKAQEGDNDGLAGEIHFPSVIGSYEEYLREDLSDTTLGMPRDLNGDGTIDSYDHAGDYQILPVCIRVRWNGRGGDKQYELTTLLMTR